MGMLLSLAILDVYTSGALDANGTVSAYHDKRVGSYANGCQRLSQGDH